MRVKAGQPIAQSSSPKVTEEVADIATPEINEEAPSPTLEPEKPKIAEPLLFSDLVYEPLYDTTLCAKYISKVADRINILEEAICSEEYTAKAELAMVNEVDRLYEVIKEVQVDFDKYTIWEEEHYYATKAYLFLRQNGYSDVVACGIIGNMMVECSSSGRSLDLKPYIYDPSGNYYGLCQWSRTYHARVIDASFDDQLVYLYDNIESEFRVFSYIYKSGFTFDDFLLMDDPADAALAFAKIYERCASGSYYLREDCAEVAFEYFCGG